MSESYLQITKVDLLRGDDCKTLCRFQTIFTLSAHLFLLVEAANSYKELDEKIQVESISYQQTTMPKNRFSDTLLFFSCVQV